MTCISSTRRKKNPTKLTYKSKVDILKKRKKMEWSICVCIFFLRATKHKVKEIKGMDHYCPTHLTTMK